MPLIFAIILFFNAHILLLQFLRFAAIIPKLCSKNLIKNYLQQRDLPSVVLQHERTLNLAMLSPVALQRNSSEQNRRA